MFQKTGPYNDLSEMPVLPEPGTEVIYRFLNEYTDPLSGKRSFPPTMKIPPTSKVFDKGKNKWVPVGLVGAVDQFNKPVPEEIARIWVYPQAGAGGLRIRIGEDPKKDALYLYLEVASFGA